MENINTIYNKAKKWQIGFFALNNTATNLYLFFFNFISYYATGIAGLSVMLISTIIMSMRIWDGITDPIIGYFIDRTDGKMGKFRPFMIVGNLILAITTVIIYQTTHLMNSNLRLVYFIFIYALYIIGYTFQTAVTKSGQTVLTNDPAQRPLFTLFDAAYNAIIFTGGQFLVANYLVKKHGGFNQSFFNESLTIVVVLSAIFTVMAVIGIWNKDRTEFFPAVNNKKLKVKDYINVLTGNRPLQMLIIAASTDKLAAQLKQNAVVPVMLYGILIGNYQLSGTVGLITLIPTFIMTSLGVKFATKRGLKKSLVLFTWISIILSVISIVFCLSVDMKQISLTNLNLTSLVFFALIILITGSGAVSNGVVIPMIPDCSDYETYRSGNYMPGIVGTIFSFIDKIISSLSATIVGVVLTMIGFGTKLPVQGDPVTSQIVFATMFLFFGVPILGWIASIISMKFYELDGDRMKVIQNELAKRKLKK